MNGPKIAVLKPGTGPALIRGRHNHHHGVVKLVSDLDISKVIEKDVQTRMNAGFLHESQHSQFNGRFRATSFGDRKNRPGRKPEHTEALVEHNDRKQVIVEAPDFERIVEPPTPEATA